MYDNQSRRRTIAIAKLALAGSAIGIGAMLSSGIAAASPQSEATIKSDCNAINGTYTHETSVDGHTTSRCTYEDNQGHTFHSMYDNGTFVGTGTGTREQPTTPKLPRNNLPGGVPMQR
jgi:hypothetical protein